MKVWTVYEVRNRINGRAYIGVHKTEDPNDSYMGSGKLIKLAIAKHGLENFEKTVLAAFESPKEAFEMEASLVTEDRLESGELYNLKVGGEGGWDFANQTLSIEARRENGSIGGRIARHSPERRIRSSMKLKDMHLAGQVRSVDWTGKNHSEATKAKMSASRRGRQTGASNGQFGTMWITTGVEGENRKIRKGDPILEGWRPGYRPRKRGLK